MKIHKAQGNSYLALDWVTAADITGTGTTIVDSTSMALYHNVLPDFTDLIIEAKFDLLRTAGLGTLEAWFKIERVDMFATVADANGSSDKYTPILHGITAVTRRVLLKPTIIMGQAIISLNDMYRLTARARGSEASTEWSVSNIKARLLYLPL